MSTTMTSASDGFVRLVKRAAERYRPAGRHAYWFARGKLRRDPVFAAILREGYIPQRGRLVDIGCGQGVLMALLLEAQAVEAAWPTGWAPPPTQLAMSGFDLREDAVEAGAVALGPGASIAVGDMRRTPIPPCDVVTIFDVLHYVDDAAQDAVIARCARALGSGGTLLLRVADARPAPLFWFTVACDWIVSAGRGHWQHGFACRSLPAWQALLQRHGFDTRVVPMNEGTPFANHLLIGRRPAAAGPA